MTASTTMQIPGFRGDLIGPDHHGYDDARAVWNRTVDRQTLIDRSLQRHRRRGRSRALCPRP
jgi:hypothetical protein